MTDTLAVVVPCRNEARHIGALLDALAAQTRPPDEVVIVNDGSTDETVSVIESWIRAEALLVRVIDGPGKGPGPAMNAGIRATNAAIIARMDGHAIPAPDYLQKSLHAVRSAQCGVRGAVVGGVWHVRPGAETAVARAIAAVMASPLGSGGAAYRTPGRLGSDTVEVATVPFGTFPRSVWEHLGGFDESLSANQDFDFNYRARQAGYRVVLHPGIDCEYFARPTLPALARQYFRYGFWKAQMLRKDPRALRWRQIPPALIAPWVLATAALLLGWPDVFSQAVAAVYPLFVLTGALDVGLRRRVNPVWAASALFTQHLSWSSGFWSAQFGVRRLRLVLRCIW